MKRSSISGLVEPLESRQMLSAVQMPAGGGIRSAYGPWATVMRRQAASQKVARAALATVASPAALATVSSRAALATVVAPSVGMDPTGQEQETLELINRLRAKPAAELDLLLNAHNADVDQAIADYSVDMPTLRSQWSTLKVVQPLAWNASLAKAAKGHTLLMIKNDQQAHDFTGEQSLRDRVDAQGYNPQSYISENLFAFAKSVFHAHAAFAIDWGDTTSGIQYPPGHREAVTDTDKTIPVSHREIGINILSAPRGVRQTGPLLMTQELGAPLEPGNAWLLGTVWSDLNRNGVYNAGEGRGGLRVKISNASGTYLASTLTAGAFQVRVPAGTYSTTVWGGGLKSAITRNNVVVSTRNVKQDFTVAADVTPPTKRLSVAGVKTAGGTAHTLSVTYTDESLMDTATVSSSDIEIVGPGGFRQRAILVSRSAAGNVGVVRALYQITPPGGGWDKADNGTYTVRVVSGQVKDTSGNAIPAGVIGTFVVAIA